MEKCALSEFIAQHLYFAVSIMYAFCCKQQKIITGRYFHLLSRWLVWLYSLVIAMARLILSH